MKTGQRKRLGAMGKGWGRARQSLSRHPAPAAGPHRWVMVMGVGREWPSRHPPRSLGCQATCSVSSCRGPSHQGRSLSGTQGVRRYVCRRMVGCLHTHRAPASGNRSRSSARRPPPERVGPPASLESLVPVRIFQTEEWIRFLVRETQARLGPTRRAFDTCDRELPRSCSDQLHLPAHAR